jgi:hypothetical protein
MNKMRVVDKFVAVKAMLNGEAVENFSVEDALAFLDERIAITEKKNANPGERKPTAQQMENEGIKGVIISTLSTIGQPTTIVDLQKANAELAPLSNQKISSLLTQLIKANRVVRSEVKGKAHFALATEE